MSRVTCIICGLGKSVVPEFRSSEFLFIGTFISVLHAFNHALNQINCILALPQLLSFGFVHVLLPEATKDGLKTLRAQLFPENRAHVEHGHGCV